MGEMRDVKGRVLEFKDKHKHPLLWGFTVLWLVWIGFIVTVEFGILTTPVDPWIAALGVFVVLEGTAIGLDSKGDTLSEQVFALIHDAPARIALVLGPAYFLLVRLSEIGGDQLTLANLSEINLGRGLLGLGIGAWLTVHFFREGKLG